MTDFNHLYLTGRLAHDLEAKGTPEMTIVKFRMASNAWVKKAEYTNWINCTAFKQEADYLLKYAKKGDRLIVEGALRVSEYAKKDGTNATEVQVIVGKVAVVSSSQKASKPVAAPTPPPAPALGLDDNIPF